MEMSFMAAAQALIRVNENSQVGEARRNAVRIAELTALDETDRGKVAIVATELANNLVRHTGGGEMIIRRCETNSADGVELLAIDRGPGMADIGKCMQDGFSTGGTAGTGFGAIRRLSTEFDVYSARPSGTVIASRVLHVMPGTSSRGQWSVICVPAPGETLCGDNWSIVEKNELISVLLADGLGHGPLAAQASEEAVRVFNQDPFRQPGVLLDAAHSPLRTTRGAAIAIAQCNFQRSEMKYAGVGNISGTIIANGESRGLFSHNGTVGMQIRKIQEFEYPWREKAMLIMHSDGLQSRWDLSRFPGLVQRTPAVIAGVLYRDFQRGRDDVTVVVLQ
jgi:anti-sigma regulatory factor (Ser/Thr protein kinase)